ncbi:MAG: hypothetical protein LBD23_19655 [Oscillospiraceae bacterium]|jgi:hypothetical protein|nr:hypothetical protein [Oscillospiraceae bacterium]
MLKTFALYDGNQNDRQVGIFTYDVESKIYSITINEDVEKDKLPLSLEGFVNKQKYVLSNENTLRWIRERICPPGRHNIRNILKDNEIKEYNEFELLMLTKARCDKDDLYLVEK